MSNTSFIFNSAIPSKSGKSSVSTVFSSQNSGSLEETPCEACRIRPGADGLRYRPMTVV